MNHVIYDLPANKIWQKWAGENLAKLSRRVIWNRNVANEAKSGFNRTLFESYLMEQGCYLEVKNGKPKIKGYQERSLVVFLLRWL